MLLAFLSFSSCEQESLDPLPTKVEGKYVTIDAYNTTMDWENVSNASFSGVFKAPGENISRFDLYVRRRDPNGVNSGDFVLLRSITSFPYEFNITTTEIATVLGLQVSDLQKADIYRFLGYSFDAEGNRTSYNNLSAVLRTTPTMKQGYKFSIRLEVIPPGQDPKFFNLYDVF